MADVDYLSVYRQFFEEFAKVVEPNDPLPIRVAPYNLTQDELLGEVIESSLQYLTEKNCPSSLLVPLTKMVVEEVQRETKKQGAHSYQPLKVMRTVTGKIVEICLVLTDNEKLSSLPAPVQETKISTHAIKHTRRRMEDRLICLPRFNTLYNIESNSEAGYYAVFDGHNGADAAAFSVSHLHQFLAESKHYPSDPVEAFRDAYSKTESCYLTKKLRSGTTALAILHQPAEKRLVVSWLGDSLAMIVSQGNAQMLVDPHKPGRLDEIKRIEGLGGYVANVDGLPRVSGLLAVSRAIGDVQYKPYISAEPDIRVVNLTGAEDFVVLGSDGLWDVVDPSEVIETVYFQVKRQPGQIEFVSRRLIDLAKENDSLDNISVIVVFLTDPAEIAKRSVEATGPWPTNPFQNGVIMDANFQPIDKLPFPGSLADSGMNGIYETNGKHNSIQDSNKEDSDDDFGPETDVDAVDDVLVSPSKNSNPFSNDCWPKSTQDDMNHKLIEYSRQETLSADDDIVNFTDSVNEKNPSEEIIANTKLDFNNVESNPFEVSREAEIVNLSSNGTGDKYVEDIKLGNEGVDNFLNLNLSSNPFDLEVKGKSALEEVKNLIESDLDRFDNDGNKNARNTSPNVFESENLKELKLIADTVVDTNLTEKEAEQCVSNENNATQMNLLDTITFETNDPELIFDPSENIPLDASGCPPALCSVIDVIEAQRISGAFDGESPSARDPDTETPDILSPSAPVKEGDVKDEAVAELVGEYSDCDSDEDDDWRFHKIGPACEEFKPIDLVANTTEDSRETLDAEDQKMNSPLNPDAAEFVPVSPTGNHVETGAGDAPDVHKTPIKNIPKLNDIIASSPNWANMESVKVPDETSFLKEVKSRPSNIFDGIKPLSPDGLDNSVSGLVDEIEAIPSVRETEKAVSDVESLSNEVHGIALATDMTSSFIDTSTISAQSEVTRQELDFLLHQNEAPVDVSLQEPLLNVDTPEFNCEFREREEQNIVEVATHKIPDLLSPLSLNEDLSSTSPAGETPKSTLVEAPTSPRSDPIPLEPVQSLLTEANVLGETEQSLATETPPSTPLANEEIVSRPEEINEAFEKIKVPESEPVVSAPEVAVAATAVAAVAAAAVIAAPTEKKDESKKPAQKAAPVKNIKGTTTTTTTKTAVAATKAGPAKRPSTVPPKATTARTVNGSSATGTSAPKTSTARSAATARTTPKPSSPSTQTTPTAPKTTPRPRTTTAATTPSTKPAVPASRTTARPPVSGVVKTSTTTRTSTLTSASTASTTPKPKPRVPSAPIQKKTTTGTVSSTTAVNGDAKAATKRPEPTPPKRPGVSAPPRTTVSSRPATAPSKSTTLKPSSTTTAAATKTLTNSARAKPLSTTTAPASRVTPISKKPATDTNKQTKELANKTTSKTTSVPKTNGVANGRVSSNVNKTTKPQTTSVPSKTETKAEKIIEKVDEIVKSEIENQVVENNKEGSLVNGVGGE